MSAAFDESPRLAELFKILGDETRVRILGLLTHGELCVCHLVTGLDLPQSTVSRQLAILRRAGLVTARREGTWMHYALCKPDVPLIKRQLDHLRREFSSDTKLKSDVQRLLGTRNSLKCR